MCVSQTLLPFYPMIVLTSLATDVVCDTRSMVILSIENLLRVETLSTSVFVLVSCTLSLVNQYNNVEWHSSDHGPAIRSVKLSPPPDIKSVGNYTLNLLGTT